MTNMRGLRSISPRHTIDIQKGRNSIIVDHHASEANAGTFRKLFAHDEKDCPPSKQSLCHPRLPASAMKAIVQMLPANAQISRRGGVLLREAVLFAEEPRKYGAAHNKMLLPISHSPTS